MKPEERVPGSSNVAFLLAGRACDRAHDLCEHVVDHGLHRVLRLPPVTVSQTLPGSGAWIERPGHAAWAYPSRLADGPADQGRRSGGGGWQPRAAGAADPDRNEHACGDEERIRRWRAFILSPRAGDRHEAEQRGDEGGCHGKRGSLTGVERAAGLGNDADEKPRKGQEPRQESEGLRDCRGGIPALTILDVRMVLPQGRLDRLPIGIFCLLQHFWPDTSKRQAARTGQL